MICSLILGALIGWIAGKLMGSRGGLIRNLILGVQQNQDLCFQVHLCSCEMAPWGPFSSA